MTSPPPAPPGDRQAELGFQGSGGGAGLVSAGGRGSWPDVGDAVLVLKETRSLVRRGLAGGGHLPSVGLDGLDHPGCSLSSGQQEVRDRSGPGEDTGSRPHGRRQGSELASGPDSGCSEAKGTRGQQT